MEGFVSKQENKGSHVDPLCVVRNVVCGTGEFTGFAKTFVGRSKGGLYATNNVLASLLTQSFPLSSSQRREILYVLQGFGSQRVFRAEIS